MKGDDTYAFRIIKIGGYALILKEFANRYAMTRKIIRSARRTDHAKKLLLGTGIGTLAGAAAGLLFAPRSGREMRRQIAERTGETLTNIKEMVIGEIAKAILSLVP